MNSTNNLRAGRQRWLSSWLCGLLVIGPTPVVWAGAWTVPEDRWYAEYFYRYFGSKKEFSEDGNTGRRPKTAVYRDIRNEWKLEYGIKNWWNMLASVPYISSHYRDDGIDVLRTGVGDIYLRTKFRALNKPLLADEEPFVGSVQFSAKIPSAYDPIENPIGDGQVDFESRLQLSQGWVFAPYEVSIPKATHRAARRAAAQPPFPATTPASRDAAIREAVVVAELYQHGLQLWEEGREDEATQYFQAVLTSTPAHREVMRLLRAHGTPVLAPPAEDGYALLVNETKIVEEAFPENAFDTERRYARVMFVNLEGGFSARNEDPANECPLFFEAGFTPFKRLMLVGSVDSILSIRSTHEQIENFAKWGVRAIVNLWGDGFAAIFRTGGGATVNVEVGYNDLFAGRNTADAFEVFGKLGMAF